MADNRQQARELAARPYFVIVTRDSTIEADSYVYLARDPEIARCKAQGLTVEEARENLDDVRVDLFEHYLDHGLPIPDPAWNWAHPEIYVNEPDTVESGAEATMQFA